MKIDCKTLATLIEEHIKKEVKTLEKQDIKPSLTTILVGSSSEQLSFVAIKKKVAERLGIHFDFIHIKRTPSFQQFAEVLKKKAQEQSVHGMIVQQPLPSRLSSDTIYNFIPLEKEIEGHKDKSTFLPPLGLAVLSTAKFVLDEDASKKSPLIVSKNEAEYFNALFKNKKVVLIGKGATGGVPIGKTLSALRVGYLNISSTTTEPERFIKEADVVITAVGRKVIKPQDLKKGAILLNVGLRKEKGKLKGDYDEEKVEDIASYYSPTPGGIGPIDVLYLFQNLMNAIKLQTKNPEA